MKNILIQTVIFLLFALGLQAQNNQTTDLTVNLVNLKSDKGQLMVALYDQTGNWLSKEYMGEITKIVDGKATVVFKAVPYGEYAVSSVHDENNNEKLDTGWFGIPTEPYASSRGAKGKFGPPKWEDAIFKLDKPTATEIIKY